MTKPDGIQAETGAPLRQSAEIQAEYEALAKVVGHKSYLCAILQQESNLHHKRMYELNQEIEKLNQSKENKE